MPVRAGISMGCGLPGWTALAADVLERLPRQPGPILGAFSAAIERGERPPYDPNALRIPELRALQREGPLFSMRYARAYPGVTDFNGLVAQALYATPPALSSAARAIPALERAIRICCFNYGDVLDRAFTDYPRTYHAVFAGQPYDLSSPETLIFYPHGYLPDPNRESYRRTPAIILSEDDYFQLANEPDDWTNTLQHTLLLNMTALFVGCSLIDPNVRRLLYNATRNRANHQHYAILPVTGQRQHPTWYQQHDAVAYKHVQQDLLRDLGARPLWLRNFDHLTTILGALRAPTPNTLDDTLHA